MDNVIDLKKKLNKRLNNNLLSRVDEDELTKLIKEAIDNIIDNPEHDNFPPYISSNNRYKLIEAINKYKENPNQYMFITLSMFNQYFFNPIFG